MINNDDIQAALLSYYQSKTAITDELDSIEEIKELFYQSTDFKYPGVRIGNIVQTPLPNNCPGSSITFSVYVMDENDSSYNCTNIAYEVANESHSKSFSKNSLHFTGMRVTRYPSSVRMDQRTWRNQIDLAVANVVPL